MAKTDLSVKIGAQFVGKDAFDKAEKSLKRLGKQGAALFLGGSILNFGKSSVQAFYESEKQAKSLYQTLNNLGMAMEAPAVNDYIKKLSLASGIVDDELNPAFQRLLIATKDVGKAQALLKTSLDVSAGTGKGLEATTTAISKAYLGNTTALQRLGVGLSATQLKAGDFDSTITALNNNFYGQASAAVEGYTGQIDRLGIAYDQLKERVGKSILDIGGSIGRFIEYTKLGLSTGLTIDAKEQAKLKGVFFNNKNMAAGFGNVWDRNKNAKAQAIASDKQLKATKALTKAQQDQLKLKKAGTMFDVEQAGILIALQGKITDNEKLRLQLQLALLEGNTKEADRLSNELLLSQARTTGLATFIANLPKALNPFADYPYYVQQALDELAKLAAAQKNLGSSTPSNPLYQYNSLSQQLVQGSTTSSAQGYGGGVFNNNLTPSVPLYGYNSMSQSDIIVQVQIGGQEITDVVTNTQINNSASGSQSRLNRLALMD
jgi:hypothetical protein